MDDIHFTLTEIADHLSEVWTLLGDLWREVLGC